MRRYFGGERPRLKSALFETAEAEWRKLLRQIEEMNGVGSHLPREDGGLVPVRFNGSEGRIEYLKGGKWQALGGQGSGVGGQASGDSGIRNSVGADGSLYHNSLSGIQGGVSNDYQHLMGVQVAKIHDALTVSDTGTIDLTLTGQALSAAARTQMSITSDANGLKLSGDAGSPGNSKYFGTNAGGTKGWYALPVGSGDVVGPASSVDGHVALFNGTTGKAIKDSGKSLADFVEVAGDTMTGSLVIDGSADAVQLRVQGHSSQTANIFEIEDSAGADLVVIDKDGNLVYTAYPFTILANTADGSDTGRIRILGGGGTGSSLDRGGAIQVFGNESDMNSKGRLYLGAGTVSTAGTFDGCITFTTGGNVVACFDRSGDLNLFDGTDIIAGATTGIKIGTGTTQKLGFYNATPIVRPAAYTQTYSTADKTHALSTYLTPFGGSVVDMQCRASLAQLAADMVDVKQLINAVIDDLQSLGLTG